MHISGFLTFWKVFLKNSRGNICPCFVHYCFYHAWRSNHENSDVRYWIRIGCNSSIHFAFFTVFWGALILPCKNGTCQINSRKYYLIPCVLLGVLLLSVFYVALADESVTHTTTPKSTEESGDDAEDQGGFWQFWSHPNAKAETKKPSSEKSTKTSLLYHILNSPVDEEQENMRSDFIRSYFRSRNALGTYTERLTPFAFMCIIIAVIVVVLVVVFTAYFVYRFFLVWWFVESGISHDSYTTFSTFTSVLFSNKQSTHHYSIFATLQRSQSRLPFRFKIRIGLICLITRDAPRFTKLSLSRTCFPYGSVLTSKRTFVEENALKPISCCMVAATSSPGDDFQFQIKPSSSS